MNQVKRCGLILAIVVGVSGFARADLNEGLVAYWPLDDNFVDVVGDNHGQFMGLDDPVFEPGVFGNGIRLDGEAESFIEIANEENFDFIEQDFSVSAWFTVGGFDKNWQALIAKGEGNRWRVHRRGGDGILTWNGGNGDVPAYAEGDFGLDPLTNGELHHFVGVSNFGTGSIDMYIDGELVASNESPAVQNNDMPVMIGENPDARGRTWNGLIDDVAIWGRALDESDVAVLYNGGAGTQPTNSDVEIPPVFIGEANTVGSRLYEGDVSNRMFGPVESGVPGWSARMVTFDEHGETLDSQTTADFILEDFDGQPGDGAFSVVDFGGGGGSFGETQPYPVPDATDDFVVEATANVTIPAGEWTIGVGSDDGGRVTIGDDDFEFFEWAANADPNSALNDVRFEGTRGHDWTVASFTLDEPLETSINAAFFERGGGDSFEVAILNEALDGDTLATNPGANEADGWELLADGTFDWSVTTEAAPLVSADIAAEARAQRPIEIDVDGTAGTSDQLVVENPDPEVFTTSLNIDGLEFQINALNDVADGTTFKIIDADVVVGTPSILTEGWSFDAATGSIVFGDGGGGGTCVPNTGDFNGDNEVNFSDFLALSANFGGQGGQAEGDTNCDGEINFTDFLTLSANFGTSTAASAVPEPSTATLLGMAGLLFGLVRRRRS